ncbi:hypothetical protein KFL_005470070 [Klebsormidium nitens]|uniref:Carbohydrate kinase PfkB domain-containing protein n=1 Tax=Klebsormidium nitens TaxID=105231 RepID=A0A1Y1IFK5_KLENI|nr:hypothetical protein KFL_005470070 [Klebsormidium nitens]|eukprot:GAQ89655.1 hypothetical protein KFL_005470070 [Klebsormidium nitens]
MDYVTFTLIVDDIVWPDGHTAMACLGGGGPQTAFAIRMWTNQASEVGLAAGVGEDLPQACKDWFNAMRINTQGLERWDGFQTLRAWQVLEADGRRTQVWRTPVGEEVWGMLRPKLRTLPSNYQKARAYHVGVHPSGLDVNFIRELKDSGAEVVSIEPYTHALDVVPRAELEALLTSAHIFSPNEKEAFSLVGPGEPLEVVARLVEAGAQVVCLRRGDKGCVVHRADTGETWDVPAVDMSTTTADEGLESTYRGASDRSTAGSDSVVGSRVGNLDESDVGSDVGASGGDIEASVQAAWASALPPLEKRESLADELDKLDGRSSVDTNSGLGAEMAVRTGRVKDPTGCGNAFCGGFLVGWLEHRDLLTGALYGSVAASFMLEHEGVPPPSAWRNREAFKRVDDLRIRARRL